MNDQDWIHSFINCMPFGAHAPQEDIDRAHNIVKQLQQENVALTYFENAANEKILRLEQEKIESALHAVKAIEGAIVAEAEVERLKQQNSMLHAVRKANVKNREFLQAVAQVLAKELYAWSYEYGIGDEAMTANQWLDWAERQVENENK